MPVVQRNMADVVKTAPSFTALFPAHETVTAYPFFAWGYSTIVAPKLQYLSLWGRVPSGQT